MPIAQAPLEPLAYAPADQIVRRGFANLRPPERLTVSEAALTHRILDNPLGYSGPWTFDLVPFLRRPMDCLNRESPYSTVALMGPAQSAKSSVGDNWLLYVVVCAPADMIFAGSTKTLVRDYVVTQINKMVRLCPAMHSRLRLGPGSDNIFAKSFLGCNFFAVWPVASQMRQRPAPYIRIDDYDALPEDIEGEGNALMLLGGRQTTFEGEEMTLVNSSPALGFKKGIEAVVATGTDERWFVRCLHCDGAFDLDFDERLTFDRAGTPEDAKRSAEVVCPHCGSVHEQKDKHKLMARGAWCGPDQTLLEDGTIDGDLAPTSIASFRINGLMGFASWGRLAELWRMADIAFENAQDEGELRAFYNVREGKNYKSRIAGAAPVEAGDIMLRAADSDYRMGTIPDGVIALTAAIDVQKNRFEVLVKGWGVGFQSWVIARYAIIALEDGVTKIDPASKPEHWGTIIEKVIWKKWPLADDPDIQVPILNVAIDTGGEAGVTDNAFAFWYKAIGLAIPATAITLIKGGNKPLARLLPPPTIDAKRKARKGDPDAELFVPNVHRFKDMVDVRLRRPNPGPGYMNFPADFAEEHAAELTSEEKIDGLWYRPKGVANETLDLDVYSTVALMRVGGSDASLDWVPLWARAPSMPTRAPVVEKQTPPPRRGPRIRSRKAR